MQKVICILARAGAAGDVTNVLKAVDKRNQDAPKPDEMRASWFSLRINWGLAGAKPLCL